MSPHDLRELTRKVMDLLRLDLEDKQISVRVEVDQLKIMADGDMMVQVLFNLLMNASQILPEGGKISLRTESRGDSVDLHVIDNGPGFPRDLGESCFQPYVTQREGGTGLGLAVVQQILVSHGANLELLESEEGAHLLISGLRKSPS
jgi:nitrogen fixation/metabolism regulation signal transduction histidine kinase